jgi:hypothetical protein
VVFYLTAQKKIAMTKESVLCHIHKEYAMAKKAVSTKLIEAVGAHGWTFYDVSGLLAGRITWAELDKKKPPTCFRRDGVYQLIPCKKQGETVEQAHASSQDLVPTLRIQDINDSRWSHVAAQSPKIVMLSHLLLSSVQATCLSFSGRKVQDCVIIPRRAVVDTFQKYFSIISREEHQRMIDAYRMSRALPIMFPMGEMAATTFRFRDLY